MIKTLFDICLKKNERWCLCNLLFLRSNTWLPCSKKADFFWFKWRRMFSLRGAYLQVSQQGGGRHPRMFTCYVLEIIYFYVFFWMMIVSKRTNIQYFCITLWILSILFSIWLENSWGIKITHMRYLQLYSLIVWTANCTFLSKWNLNIVYGYTVCLYMFVCVSVCVNVYPVCIY